MGPAGWHLPWRCKVCPDGIGEAADIAASDTWIGGTPNEADSKTDLGANAMVIRTKAGQELYEAAVAAGFLAEKWDIAPDMMSVYQPHQMQKKYYVWARHQGLADGGSLVPQTENLRIEELAREMPETFLDGQRAATAERVARGRNSEPQPIPFDKSL
jgi:Coenzyme F420 hydrogenase/dehydrogenase, beta subunit C terminus.